MEVMKQMKQNTEGFEAWLDADRNAIHAVIRAMPDSVSNAERSEAFELIEQISELLHQLDALTDNLIRRAQEDADKRTAKAKKV